MSAEKIRTITSLDELDGYEAEAKKRGIEGDELRAIFELRKQLTPKKKRGRK